jgi:ferredoxin-NADP reductase
MMTDSAVHTEQPPQRPRKVYDAIIERRYDHTEDTRSLFLRIAGEQRLAFRPGQFLSFLLPAAGQELIRPYSLASDPEENETLEICFNLVPGGLGSAYLFEREVGDVLRFTGPWGTFGFDQPPQTECVFIADGPAIAPLRPMMKRALSASSSQPIRLLYSAVREERLLYRREFESWAQEHARFCFAPLLQEPPAGWSGLRGSLLEQVEQCYIRADENRSRHFFICGVGARVTRLRDLLRRAGYERRAVQYEKW